MLPIVYEGKQKCLFYSYTYRCKYQHQRNRSSCSGLLIFSSAVYATHTMSRSFWTAYRPSIPPPHTHTVCSPFHTLLESWEPIPCHVTPAPTQWRWNKT